LSSPTAAAVSDIGAEVKRLVGISDRNRAKAMRVFQQSANPNLISSDDE